MELHNYRYDLHIHSCLSACAEEEMTPANIAGMAHLLGIELLAVTDHNSARNLPAAKAACEQYGIRLLPGIEANTAEEIHLLLYFPTVEQALEAGRWLERSVPDFPKAEPYFGSQIVMNPSDIETERVEKLLSNASAYTLEQVVATTKALGGIAVPAHIDRDSYSLLAVLGQFPKDPAFAAVELMQLENAAGLIQRGLLPAGLSLLSSSDAHALTDLREENPTLPPDNPIWQLLK